MSALLPWFKAHWEDVLVGVGVVYVVAVTIANRYTKDGKPIPTWVRAMLDVLSLAPFPFVPAGKKPPVNGAAVALLVGALALSGCALSPAGKAHVALRTAAEIGEGADKAITSYDTMIQDGAVLEAEAAGSTAGARAKLAEWRPKRMKARGIEQEYLAGVLGWQVALQIAENSLEKKPFDVGALLAGLAGLAQNLVQGLRKLGIEVPKIGVF
jgi:hypothetical protein